MDLWRSELDKAGRLSELLSDGAVTGPARVCPASVYRAVRYAEPGLLLVGDAGSFLDPLSSYGVKKALSSAWLAGVVPNTLLSEEEMTSPALATYHQKEEEVVRTCAREALSFLRQRSPGPRRRVLGVPVAGRRKSRGTEGQAARRLQR